MNDATAVEGVGGVVAEPTIRLMLGDCLDRMAEIADGSVDLVACDPPYHRVKLECWDRQWETDADFLGWIGRLCGEWRRVLKPNGSLYCFASPRMAARVECKIRETFEVLNRITWRKNEGWSKRQCKEEMRAWFPASEAIIFAEHRGSDSMALGESGYAAKCDELRGFVFEPIRAYLDGERQAAGLTPEAVNLICGYRENGGMASRKWFGRSQFNPPTAVAYAKVQTATGRFLRPYEDLRREYEDLRREYEDLRREYEDLHREYEDLRRPFDVGETAPYTDVWDFPTVPQRPGKHPCEKPLEMMEHIIRASSRPGDVVLDPCMGGGTTGKACRKLGRAFIGIEKDARYFRMADRRIADALRPVSKLDPRPAYEPLPGQLSLFDEARP